MIEFFRLVQATQRTTYKSEAAALVEFLESLMGHSAVIVRTLDGASIGACASATPSEIGTCSNPEATAPVPAVVTSAKKQVNWLRRIGAALNEDDNSKLAAKVEALARDCSDAQRELNQLKGQTA